jgi:mannose-6-phosphate isomerase-like protein (cupin superfamily)
MSIESGEGWATGNLDDMGEGPGFRKIRRELDVKEMGVNAIVLPPGIEQGMHWHERQEELYFVHSGEIEMEFGDGSKQRISSGGMARVDAATKRTIRNHGPEMATYVIVGAEGGYVGRDGVADPNEPRVKPIAS